MSIETIEEAEEFFQRNERRIVRDELMVNATVAAVALGASRDTVKAAKRELGITTRRCYLAPLRRHFKKQQCRSEKAN